MRFKAEKSDPQTSEEPQNSEKTAEEIEFFEVLVGGSNHFLHSPS